MNRGVPPTARKARTGLLTPPGVTPRPRAKSSAETGRLVGVGRAVRRGHDPSVPSLPGRPSEASDTAASRAARRAAGVAGGHEHGAPVGQPQRQAGAPGRQRPPAAEHRRPGVHAAVDGRQVRGVDVAQRDDAPRPTARPSEPDPHRPDPLRRERSRSTSRRARRRRDTAHSQRRHVRPPGSARSRTRKSPRAPATSQKGRQEPPGSTYAAIVSRGQPAGGLDRPVGEHLPGAGPADGGQRLEDRPLAVHPAVGGGRLDHRVLAADLVGAHRHLHRVGDPARRCPGRAARA